MIKTVSNNYADRIKEIYKYDKMNTLDDVKEVISLLSQKGFDVSKIKVRELADYDVGSTVRVYHLDNLDEMLRDFEDKMIQSFILSGIYKNSKFTATIDPIHNTMIMDYLNVHKHEIEEMMQETDEKNI